MVELSRSTAMRGSSIPPAARQSSRMPPTWADNVLGINSAYLVDLGKVFGGEVSMNYDSLGTEPILFRAE